MLHIKLQTLYQRYKNYWPATFFLLGIVWDIFTLGQIDDLFNILQQAIYLIVIYLLLVAELFHQFTQWRLSRRLEKLWPYREMVTHFFFGSLLSSYTMFYFKSASLWASGIFLLLLTILLVINEFEKFQKLGPLFKFSLLQLCITSYCIYLVPVLVGSIGIFIFLLSMLVATAIFLGFGYLVYKKLADLKLIKKQLLLPAACIQCIVLLLYLFRAIPPVPLSIEFAGIYHQIDKQGDQYQLYHENPWWRFWHNGDQLFYARSGDRLYTFVRIFCPTRFRDTMRVRWLFKEPHRGWQSADAIPIQINGGRKEGYRGYSFKENFSPGKWRVRFESEDGREIGRINFRVVADINSALRAFTIDKQ